MTTRNMRTLITLILLLPLTAVPVSLAAGSDGRNAPEHFDKPYLILISIDGFGWDARSRADTPALDLLADTGVVARSMQPAWPSLTFPNHYAIATVLYPAEHGIVGNKFPNGARDAWYALYDREAVQNPDWYEGEPIWVVAEKAGMVAAAYFFVGTEAPVQGLRPTYSYLYDENVDGMTRVGQVLDWLALPDAERPHLVTLYFEDVDVTSHRHGPAAPETAAAIERVDGYIAALLAGLDALSFRDDVHIVVVSDHGQSEYTALDEAYVLDEHVDIGAASVVQGGNYVMLYYEAPDPERIESIVATINGSWTHGRAYARGNTPAHWRVSDDERYPDLFIQADAGHAVVTDRARLDRLSVGAHGWPPESAAMGATFIANGKRLPAGRRVGEISVVDVFPLMLDILGLSPPPGYTAEPSALDGILLSPAADTSDNGVP